MFGVLFLIFVGTSLLLVIAYVVFVGYLKRNKKDISKLPDNNIYYIVLVDTILESAELVRLQSILLFRNYTVRVYKQRYLLLMLLTVSTTGILLATSQKEVMIFTNDVYSDLIQPILRFIFLYTLACLELLYEIFIPIFNFFISVLIFFRNLVFSILTNKELFMSIINVLISFTRFVSETIMSVIKYARDGFFKSPIDMYTPTKILLAVPSQLTPFIDSECTTMSNVYQLFATALNSTSPARMINSSINSVVYLTVRMIPNAIESKKRPTIVPFYDTLISSVDELGIFLDILLNGTVKIFYPSLSVPGASKSTNFGINYTNILAVSKNISCFFCISSKLGVAALSSFNTTFEALLNLDHVFEGIFDPKHIETTFQNDNRLRAISLLNYNNTFKFLLDSVVLSKDFLESVCIDNEYVCNFTRIAVIIPPPIIYSAHLIIESLIRMLFYVERNTFVNLRSTLSLTPEVNNFWESAFNLTQYVGTIFTTISNAIDTKNKINNNIRNDISKIITNIGVAVSSVLGVVVSALRVTLDVIIHFDLVLTQITEHEGSYIGSPNSTFTIFTNDFFNRVNQSGIDIGGIIQITDAKACEYTFDYICEEELISFECAVGNSVKSSSNLITICGIEVRRMLESTYTLNFCNFVPNWFTKIRPAVITFVKDSNYIIGSVVRIFGSQKCTNSCVSAKLSSFVNSCSILMFVTPFDIIFDMIDALASIFQQDCSTNTQVKTLKSILIHAIFVIFRQFEDVLVTFARFTSCFFGDNSFISKLINLLATLSEGTLSDVSYLIADIIELFFDIITVHPKQAVLKMKDLIFSLLIYSIDIVGYLLETFFHYTLGGNAVCEMCGIFKYILTPFLEFLHYLSWGRLKLEQKFPCCKVCACPYKDYCTTEDEYCVRNETKRNVRSHTEYIDPITSEKTYLKNNLKIPTKAVYDIGNFVESKDFMKKCVHLYSTIEECEKIYNIQKQIQTNFNDSIYVRTVIENPKILLFLFNIFFVENDTSIIDTTKNIDNNFFNSYDFCSISSRVFLELYKKKKAIFISNYADNNDNIDVTETDIVHFVSHLSHFYVNALEASHTITLKLKLCYDIKPSPEILDTILFFFNTTNSFTRTNTLGLIIKEALGEFKSFLIHDLSTIKMNADERPINSVFEKIGGVIKNFARNGKNKPHSIQFSNINLMNNKTVTNQSINRDIYVEITDPNDILHTIEIIPECILCDCKLLREIQAFVTTELSLVTNYYNTCMPSFIKDFENVFNANTNLPKGSKCNITNRLINVKIQKIKANTVYASNIIQFIIDLTINPAISFFADDIAFIDNQKGEGGKKIFDLIFQCDSRSLYCQNKSPGIVKGFLLTLITIAIVSYILQNLIDVSFLLVAFVLFVPLLLFFSYLISPFCLPALPTCLMQDIYSVVSYFIPSSIRWGCFLNNNSSFVDCANEIHIKDPFDLILFYLYWIAPSSIDFLRETRVPIIFEIVRIDFIFSKLSRFDGEPLSCAQKNCMLFNISLFAIPLLLSLLSFALLRAIAIFFYIFLLFVFNITFALWNINVKIIVTFLEYFINEK